MAFRQLLAKAVMPNLEQDLSRTLTSSLASQAGMVDNMLAPNVYAFAGSQSAGAIQAGKRLHAPVHKVEIPVKKEGLFQDTTLSWH